MWRCTGKSQSPTLKKHISNWTLTSLLVNLPAMLIESGLNPAWSELDQLCWYHDLDGSGG